MPTIYEPPYKLREWLSEDEIDWYHFSSNPRAIEIIKNNIEKLGDSCWRNLLEVETYGAVEIIKENIEFITTLPYDEHDDIWFWISTNSCAIDFLKDNPDKINWDGLSRNSAALDMLKDNPDKISIPFVCQLGCKDSIEFVEKNIDKINWLELGSNQHAIDLIKNNLDKIIATDWFGICHNPNIDQLFEDNIDKIDWSALSSNPNAIDILMRYPDKIDWGDLCENPMAIDIIKENIDKIMLEYGFLPLSANPNPEAMELIKKYNNWHLNDGILNSHSLWENPEIFVIDYKRLEERISPFKKELIEKSLHPTRFKKYLMEYNYIICADEDWNNENP